MKKRKSKSVFDEVDNLLIDIDEPVFTSGVVSRLLDIPVWVLKQLDREGVVSPPRVSSQASRLYSQRQFNKLNKVWHVMSKRGINVNSIKLILEFDDHDF